MSRDVRLQAILISILSLILAPLSILDVRTEEPAPCREAWGRGFAVGVGMSRMEDWHLPVFGPGASRRHGR